MIRRLLLSWLVLAVALALTVWIIPGLHIHWSAGTFLITAAVFGLVNAFLGTILRILSFPLPQGMTSTGSCSRTRSGR